MLVTGHQVVRRVVVLLHIVQPGLVPEIGRPGVGPAAGLQPLVGIEAAHGPRDAAQPAQQGIGLVRHPGHLVPPFPAVQRRAVAPPCGQVANAVFEAADGRLRREKRLRFGQWAAIGTVVRVFLPLGVRLQAEGSVVEQAQHHTNAARLGQGQHLVQLPRLGLAGVVAAQPRVLPLDAKAPAAHPDAHQVATCSGQVVEPVAVLPCHIALGPGHVHAQPEKGMTGLVGKVARMAGIDTQHRQGIDRLHREANRRAQPGHGPALHL